MTSEEAKATTKAGEMVLKGINDGFRALNTNLVDAANSLRKLAEAGVQATDDYWHPAIGPNGCVPSEEYNWVMIKRRTLGRDMKPSGSVLPVPQIARFVGGKWENEVTGDYYGSESYPYEVVYWRPIPGDCCTTLFANNQAVRRDHTYE